MYSWYQSCILLEKSHSILSFTLLYIDYFYVQTVNKDRSTSSVIALFIFCSRQKRQHVICRYRINHVLLPELRLEQFYLLRLLKEKFIYIKEYVKIFKKNCKRSKVLIILIILSVYFMELNRIAMLVTY